MPLKFEEMKLKTLNLDQKICLKERIFFFFDFVMLLEREGFLNVVCFLSNLEKAR